MKQRLLLILILIMLALFGCTPSTGACPTPTTESKLLMNAEDGYCLLYPTEFSAGTAPYILVLNPVGAGAGDVLGDAWVSIDMERADGRAAAQVADAEITSSEFVGLDLNIERTEVQVDGEQAIVVDGLPGPDAWRRVFIVHGERLYILTFLPWLPNEDNGGQPTPLENLYETIISSLHFLPPTKPLPTPVPVWGSDNLPPALRFEYPLDGAVLDYEGDYHFKVTEIPGAEAYRWSFTQNGFVVWNNLRDELGTTAGGMYSILNGSDAHSRFKPGPVEVSVRAHQGEYFAEPTTITIMLR